MAVCLRLKQNTTLCFTSPVFEWQHVSSTPGLLQFITGSISHLDRKYKHITGNRDRLLDKNSEHYFKTQKYIKQSNTKNLIFLFVYGEEAHQYYLHTYLLIYVPAYKPTYLLTNLYGLFLYSAYNKCNVALVSLR